MPLLLVIDKLVWKAGIFSSELQWIKILFSYMKLQCMVVKLNGGFHSSMVCSMYDLKRHLSYGKSAFVSSKTVRCSNSL